jgi:tRNA-specific 2-thiouridylase
LFEREVVNPFVEAYLRGETPSPCVSCNRGVKMRELFELANRLDASKIATGHYARIDASGPEPRLRRARDGAKDQSYFLHMLDATALARLVFPLGEATKAEVRKEALDLGLPGATKGESQELCFVPTGRYDEFVKLRADGRARPGRIVDQTGKQVGEHAGLFRFTVGQRKNLGVAVGHRAYVTALDPETETVHLGSREELATSTAELGNVTLATGVSLPLRADVVVRYHAAPVPARITAKPARGADISFDAPVNAVVPGQVAVFYDGDTVLGGGTITTGTGRRSQSLRELAAGDPAR